MSKTAPADRNTDLVPAAVGEPGKLRPSGSQAPRARFRVSYSFVGLFEGDEDAIRKVIRDLSFSTAFDPDDLNHWRVTRTEDGQYLLAAQRTLVDEIAEASERAALRKFLYGMDLPDTINVANIRIERLEDRTVTPSDAAAAVVSLRPVEMAHA